jgi:probable rRNA maturation factor
MDYQLAEACNPNMTYCIDIQIASQTTLPVTKKMIEQWVSETLRPHLAKAELTLRFVDTEEITQLNHTYRNKNQPTNVLAFPADHPEHVQLDYPFLGFRAFVNFLPVHPKVEKN